MECFELEISRMPSPHNVIANTLLYTYVARIPRASLALVPDTGCFVFFFFWYYPYYIRSINVETFEQRLKGFVSNPLETAR